MHMGKNFSEADRHQEYSCGVKTHWRRYQPRPHPNRSMP